MIVGDSTVAIVGRTPAIDEKVRRFLCVTLLNYKLCDNGNTYGAIAQRKVCSCASIFEFFYGPQNFPIGENLYQKLPFFAILGL